MLAPRVSVCLPTYNRAHYLPVAIQSILDQNFKDFELVICDNASTDGTPDVVRGFRDARIRYRRNPRNLGVAGNWMTVVQASTGQYCGIIGDDDRWDPEFLERLIEPLEQDASVDIAFCDHWVIDAQGKVLPEASDEWSRGYGRDRLRPGLHRPFLKLALENQAFWHGAALIRRERIAVTGALDPEAGLVIDYYFFSKLALAGGGAFYVPQRLSYYRRHSRSLVATGGSRLWRDLQWSCATLSRELPRGQFEAQIRDKWVAAIIHEGLSLLRAGRAGAAARAFGRAACIAAGRPRRWMDAARSLARCLWRGL